MRAFISIDLEGMPHIVSVDHLVPKRPLYDEARKIITRVTLAAIEALHENGFGEIVVADSHGPMINLLVEDLPEYVEVVRGFPRPTSMVYGVENCSLALFLGYHAKAGTAKSTFDHTYSGASVSGVWINGVEASEFLLNTWIAGHYDVPVVLVAGEEKLLVDDVAKFTPWAERIVLKRSASRYAAVSPSLTRIERMIRDGVDRAVRKFRSGECKPLKVDCPVELKVRFMKSGFADAVELLPNAERIDALTVKYMARDMVEAYKVFELMILAAYAINAMTMPK